jgi:hypothetical protein
MHKICKFRIITMSNFTYLATVHPLITMIKPKPKYVTVLISLWLFLFAAQPKDFFLDGSKRLEQRSLSV